jgi:hypothetical protein
MVIFYVIAVAFTAGAFINALTATSSRKSRRYYN